MRWSEIISEAVNYDDFRAHGIEPEVADRFAKYPLGAEDIAFYIRLGKGVDGALKMLERERIKGTLRRAGERASDKMVSALPDLRNADRSISYRTACAMIANDDELWTMVLGWTQNADYAEDRPDLAAKFLSVLKRINPPVRKHLYRGQMSFGTDTEDKRGFHSWSANRATAEMFAERHGTVLEIDRPIQGVALEDLVTWRMRLRQDESHYSGPQAEWFVVDQPEQYGRLTEVNLIPDIDDEGNAYRMSTIHQQAARSDATNVGRLPGGYQVLVNDAGEQASYYVTGAHGEVVGRARVDQYGRAHRVGHVWFKPEFRGKGIGYQLYKFLLNEQGLSIISDWDQTKAAKRVWIKLAREGYVHEWSRDHGIGKKVTNVEPYYSDIGSFGTSGLLIAQADSEARGLN